MSVRWFFLSCRFFLSFQFFLIIGLFHLFRLLFAELDDDLSEQVFLHDADLLIFHQFEDHEERDDDFHLVGSGLKKFPEIGAPVGRQIRAYVELLIGDTDLFSLDLAEGTAYGIHPVFLAPKDIFKNSLKALQRLFPDQLLIIDGRHIPRDFLGQILRLVVAEPCIRAPVPEFLGQKLVLFVLKESLHQLISGIALLFLIALGGQQHPALDVQKRRRHHEEFAGDIHILIFHLLHIFQILVRDRHDGNIIDIDLVLFDQVHEQIHRTLKHLELKRDRHITLSLLQRRFPLFPAARSPSIRRRSS